MKPGDPTIGVEVQALGDLARINRDAEVRNVRDGALYIILALNLLKKKGNAVRILSDDQIIIEPFNYFGEAVLLIGGTLAQVKIPINSVKMPIAL